MVFVDLSSGRLQAWTRPYYLILLSIWYVISTMSGLGARGRVVGFLNNKHGQTIDLLRIHFTHSPRRSARVRPLLCVRSEMNDKMPEMTSEAEKFVQSLEQEALQLDSDSRLQQTPEDSKPASELECQYNITLKDVRSVDGQCSVMDCLLCI
jgi:hypothetical protein